MRTWIYATLLGMLSLAVLPAYGDTLPDLTFSLNPVVGSGVPGSLNPDPDSCLQPNCVLFSGALADTDDDAGAENIILFDLYVVFSSTPASGALTVDNTFGDVVPGNLVGDPNWANDASEFPGSYLGPVFGIDIAPNTTPGSYSGIAYIDAAGGDYDPDYNGFTVSSETFTVDVLAPEPAPASLLFAGLLPLAAWFGAKRKWRSSAASR